MKYTEADFQSGRILGFFTDYLGWKEGTAEQIDKERWIVSDDLKWFLQHGSPANGRAFQNLIRDYNNSSDLVEDFMDSVLIPKLTSAHSAASVLRETISFKGQTFTLWNEPDVVGNGSNASELFDKNCFKVIPEATFERKYPNIDRKFNRRPDLTFFVNGIFFSYAELKLSTQGQSASNEGREKVANNLIEAITAAFESVLTSEGLDTANLPAYHEISNRSSLYNKVLHSIVLFSKSVHITTMDDSQLYILNDVTPFIKEVYDAIRVGLKSSSSIRVLKDTLPKKIKSAFQRMPDLREKTKTQAVMEHLATLYHPAHGIYAEIEYFNSYNKDQKLIRPRSAQRSMFSYVNKKVNDIYLNEHTPALSPEKIRDALTRTLPNISQQEIDQEISETLKYKNGQDQHTLILQGAAGLGKTNLIIWLAYHLISKYHPTKLKELKPVREALFDTVLILTDRTELRANISKDANKKGIVVEATTTKELVEAIKNGSKIVIYNIQKTSGLKKSLTQELKEDLSKRRFAFIIDEVHRSQNGDLNKETMEIFDECSIGGGLIKKNLIIGLTATPTEEILAKYGEWRAKTSPADNRIWVPHFAYTMQEAIDEEYILDPTLNIMTVTDQLEFYSASGNLKSPQTSDIYGNENRQKLAAKEIVKIFVRETMNAIRAERGASSGRGEGKAIVAESSIQVAIQMKPLIEESLLEEAQKVLDSVPANAPKKALEAALIKSEAIKNIVVTLVFSDTATEKCSTYNDGLRQEAIIKKFRCENSKTNKNAIMIVVDKLLTGFDEPTLHTIFLNKNINDVALFQAVCRVNRTYPNKSNCLVVDMSHNNTVAQEIPRVFNKYGGITVSDFDAGTWQEKINRNFNFLFKNEKNKEIMEHFQLWKTWNQNQKSELPVDLLDKINQLVDGSDADLEKAQQIWKNCAQWLFIYSKLKNLIDFNSPDLSKHKSPEKQQFAELLRKTLHTKLKEKAEKKNGTIIFDVVKFEETYGATVIDELDAEEDERKKKVKNTSGSGVSSIDSFDILDLLQQNENDKEKIINEVKGFMQALFLEIDKMSQAKNNDSFRKKIKQGEDMSWEQRMNEFRHLYNQANSSVSKKKLQAKTRLYATLDASFRTKLSLLESDYEAWVLGTSQLSEISANI